MTFLLTIVMFVIGMVLGIRVIGLAIKLINKMFDVVEDRSLGTKKGD